MRYVSLPATLFYWVTLALVQAPSGPQYAIFGSRVTDTPAEITLRHTTFTLSHALVSATGALALALVLSSLYRYISHRRLGVSLVVLPLVVAITTVIFYLLAVSLGLVLAALIALAPLALVVFSSYHGGDSILMGRYGSVDSSDGWHNY